MAQFKTGWVALIAGKYYELGRHIVRKKGDPGSVNSVSMFGSRKICGTGSTAHREV